MRFSRHGCQHLKSRKTNKHHQHYPGPGPVYMIIILYAYLRIHFGSSSRAQAPAPSITLQSRRWFRGDPPRSAGCPASPRPWRCGPSGALCGPWTGPGRRRRRSWSFGRRRPVGWERALRRWRRALPLPLRALWRPLWRRARRPLPARRQSAPRRGPRRHWQPCGRPWTSWSIWTTHHCQASLGLAW